MKDQAQVELLFNAIKDGDLDTVGQIEADCSAEVWNSMVDQKGCNPLFCAMVTGQQKIVNFILHSKKTGVGSLRLVQSIDGQAYETTVLHEGIRHRYVSNEILISVINHALCDKTIFDLEVPFPNSAVKLPIVYWPYFWGLDRGTRKGRGEVLRAILTSKHCTKAQFEKGSMAFLSLVIPQLYNELGWSLIEVMAKSEHCSAELFITKVAVDETFADDEDLKASLLSLAVEHEDISRIALVLQSPAIEQAVSKPGDKCDRVLAHVRQLLEALKEDEGPSEMIKLFETFLSKQVSSPASSSDASGQIKKIVSRVGALIHFIKDEVASFFKDLERENISRPLRAFINAQLQSVFYFLKLFQGDYVYNDPIMILQRQMGSSERLLGEMDREAADFERLICGSMEYKDDEMAQKIFIEQPVKESLGSYVEQFVSNCKSHISDEAKAIRAMIARLFDKSKDDQLVLLQIGRIRMHVEQLVLSAHMLDKFTPYLLGSGTMVQKEMGEVVEQKIATPSGAFSAPSEHSLDLSSGGGGSAKAYEGLADQQRAFLHE